MPASFPLHFVSVRGNLLTLFIVLYDWTPFPNLSRHFFAIKCEQFLILGFNMCLGAQQNRLIETVLLGTHNVYFVLEVRTLIFDYARLSRGLYKIRLIFWGIFGI